MPEYKRKKSHKQPHKRVVKQNKNQSEDIKMYPSYKFNKGNDAPVRVVEGRKLRNKLKLKIMAISFAVIISICVVLSLLLPVSIMENITNTVALIGAGNYPIDITGAKTLNVAQKGSYYYVLTDTNISAYTNGGKKIFDEPHGFYSPVISTSQTRALVFDQGGNELQIYNLGGVVDIFNTEKPIVNAAISRSGNFATICESDDYTAVVSVYSKNKEKLYEWNSAKDIINNIAISASGKKIAVSAINASGGKYVSRVTVLNFESADPLYTLDLGENVVLSLSDMGKGFNVITNNSYRFVDWSKYTTTEITDSGEIDMFRQTPSGALVVFNRANDKSDNTVVAISKRGKKIASFHKSGIISDIKFTHGHIYCISDTTVSLYDKTGNILRDGSCGYGAIRFSVISEYALAVITDTDIQKTELLAK